MTHHVLVADDSLTIQKVVSITLSSGDFKLIESLNESDMLAKVSSQSFDLILVDFNLSESKSGYDLCKEVHQLAPQTPIMAMLGTFDTVDDSSLKSAGILDKIVKPFESDKFIAKCTSLINSSNDSELSSDEQWSESDAGENDLVSDHQELSEDEFASQWVVEGKNKKGEESSISHEEDLDDSTSFDSDKHGEKLQSELEGWGVRVPGVIGHEKSASSTSPLPPKIASASPERRMESLNEIASDDAVVPHQDDLLYPELDLSTHETKSKLVSVGDLSSSPIEEESHLWDDDKTDPVITLESHFKEDKVEKEDTITEIQKEIEDEFSPDDFWAVDENLDDELGEFGAESYSMEELEEDSSSLLSSDITFQREDLSDEDIDKIAEKLKEKLIPLVNDLVEGLALKYCQSSIDKVAWEVIPDLAENLIRKEIQDISQSVKNH